MNEPGKKGAYAEAGVDIDAQNRSLSRIKDLARSTATPGVLSELGSFGGLFQMPAGYREPVLVASADGVGTKLAVAKMAGDFSGVGRDIVNHCVNDILVQGARPLFFLDYVGAGVLDEQTMVDLVGGVAAACRENGCALLGGETAEMPGFYRAGDYELVGFIVGVVERDKMLGAQRVRPGDVLIGLPSSGLHTNGYSLARRAIFEKRGLGIGASLVGEESVGEVLLRAHRSYLAELAPWLEDPALHALAHITGGGLTENVPRSLPEGLHAEIDLSRWPVPELFRRIQEWGEVSDEEMLRVFNLGVGLVVVVEEGSAVRVLGDLCCRGCAAFVLGRIGEGARGVHYASASAQSFFRWD